MPTKIMLFTDGMPNINPPRGRWEQWEKTGGIYKERKYRKWMKPI